MVAAPAASSARRWENRLAAASIESPRADRLSTSGGTRRHLRPPAGPKASSASPRLTFCAFEPQPRARRIVGGQHARAPAAPGRCRLSDPAAGVGSAERPSTRSISARGSAARPQQHRLVEAGDDGRIRAPSASARHRRSARCGRAGRQARAARSSATRGPDRFADGATTGRPNAAQDGARDRVAGHAHGDGIEAGGGKLRHRAIGAPGQHQGQRPRPERFRQPLGGVRRSARARAPRRASPTWAISGLKDGRPLAS